jgi:uncharacterized membrane protein YkoI
MSHKGHFYGTAAAALVAGFLLSGSVAFAQEAPPPQIPGVSVTWTQARDAALGAVPGTVLEQKMDFEFGRVAYKVEILPQGGGPKREVLIDASNGTVVSAPGVSVTWEQARDAALGAVPGTIMELKFDDDHGRVAYKAEILPQGGGFKREVLIDASNGTVLGNWQDGGRQLGPSGWYYDD